MRTLILTLFVALSASAAAANAATTGSVYVVLRNSGVGSFSSSAQVRVIADADYNAYDKSVSAPSSTVAPGSTFKAQLSGLYTWSGFQGVYQFRATFWDTDAATPKTIVLANGLRFPGTGTYYVSKLGITAYDPGASAGFDLANAAPPAANMTGCYPNAPNGSSELYVHWSLPTYLGDFNHFRLERATAGSSYYATVYSFFYWGATTRVVNALAPNTAYTFRVAMVDDYGAVTYGAPRTCTTAGDTDADDDGYDAIAYGGADCNDSNAAVNPGATDVPGNGIDEDCSGSDAVLVTDADRDGVPDAADNCPGDANADQADLDADGLGDACDWDADGDGVLDSADNCLGLANADQADLDRDGAGDACDSDADGDGIEDRSDNCAGLANADQADFDLDGSGDACDEDDDGDGVGDAVDNCPAASNADQADLDADGLGDACDADDDADGVADEADNCAALWNADQADLDRDAIGDACDTDDDGDDVTDGVDNCPGLPNADQVDVDADAIGDACDPLIDSDRDGIADSDDNCASAANADQADLDADGQGDVCDADDDGDGVPDTGDRCPMTPVVGYDLLGDGCPDTGADLLEWFRTLPASALDPNLKRSLLAKVENAAASGQAGNDKAAANKLEALVKEIQAQRGKKMSVDAADTAIAVIRAMIAG